ncbi:MAG: glycosyltransferase family 4 protein [bacterium]|nr:glycosyltransferase family 4 protein [bacterium]
MRIIFFTTKLNFETGGYSTPELDLKLRALKALGHNVTVVTLFPGINRGAIPSAYPVIEERIGTSGQLAIHYGVYGMLKKYEKRADVFHVDGTVSLYGAGLYRMLGGRTPVVAGLNREQTSFPPFRKRREKFSVTRTFAELRRNIRYVIEKTIGIYLANHIDGFVYCSPMLRDRYIRFGLDVKKSFFIFDFLDAEDILRHKRAVRARQEGEFTIFTGGRMVWEKGFDLVLTAVAKMPERKRVRVVVAGDGPELRPLQKLAHDLGVADKVEFPGWLSMDELYAQLQRADCFILPCWRPEIASALVVYSMGVGVPTIVPRGGALQWFTGDAGFAFEDQNADDLAKKIGSLMNDEALAGALIEKGFARVEELDYHEPAKAFEQLLQRIACV